MWKRKKQQENIAASVIRPPVNNTVHNHSPNHASEIFILFVCLLIAGFILWNFALYVADEMQVRNPVAAIGSFFVSVIQLGLGMWGLFYFVGKIIKPALVTWKELQLARMETEVQKAKINLQLAQSTPVGTTRTFGDDARKALIIQTVMAKAYEFIEKNERNFEYRDKWPWARQQVFSLIVDGKAVTFSEAGKVAFWLEELGIISDNKVEIGRYPDLNAVIRKLKQTYEMPIVRGSLPYPTGDNYQHINL